MEYKEMKWNNRIGNLLSITLENVGRTPERIYVLIFSTLSLCHFVYVKQFIATSFNFSPIHKILYIPLNVKFYLLPVANNRF